ncbi:MAG TPA: hypothetical protein VH950_03305 [Gaiellaceae bacterium]
MNGRAVWSVLLGALSTATMPVAVLLTRYSESYDLLHAGFAIPLGMALGAAAVATARSARKLDERTLGRLGGARTATVGRVLGILGFCIATSAAIAVGVYELLEYVGSRE